jgi:hypothetical protein
MRAYLIDGPMKSVLDKVVNAGVPSTLGNFHSIKRTPAQNVKGWSQVTMTATMIADDYVGFPAIDFYVRQFGQRTMVLVFMYSPGPDPWTASIADIVESVKVGK